MTGILNWSLEGLVRLAEQGRFTRPRSTEIALTALQDLASPVGAFVRDHCVIEADAEIPVDDLWKAWRAWAEDNGHGRGGTKQLFGRDLKAAVPRLRRTRPRTEGEERPYVYEGIRLKHGIAL